MREYTKVSPALWTSRRFLDLSLLEKVGYLFVLTNSHQNSAGCYRLPVGYAAIDLACTADEWVKIISSLVVAEEISFDTKTEELRIRRWFKHNPPMNPDHLKHIEARLRELQSASIRREAFEELEAWLVENKPAWHGRSVKAPGQRTYDLNQLLKSRAP